MVISDTYGSVQTPSENNSDYSAIVTALGVPFVVPTNAPQSAIGIAAAYFMAENGAAPGNVGGTYATFANMTRGLPQ